MSMSHGGLTKLSEECAEVIQVSAKAQALESLGDHWDGTNLKLRLEEELGDLLGIIRFVKLKHKLDADLIREQAERKYETFCKWDEQ